MLSCKVILRRISTILHGETFSVYCSGGEHSMQAQEGDIWS